MSLSVNWATKVITVPQEYLTPIGGFYYKLDVDKFRLDLKDIEDSEDGIAFLDIHRHNTEVTIGGITLARTVEIINGYTVTFEDGQYAVTLTGANNNILDVVNFNQVSIQSSNTAGLIVKEVGSAVTEQDKHDIADAVLNESVNEHTGTGSLGKHIDLILSTTSINKQFNSGKWVIDEQTHQMIFYNYDGATPLAVFNLLDAEGNPTLTNIRERRPV